MAISNDLRRTKKKNVLIEIAPSTTITELLVHLGVPDSNVAMCAVNDAVVDPSTILRDGDVLEVFEPVGGGTDDYPKRVHIISSGGLCREKSRLPR
jgi:thiamine biosynthesis protein ThiS